MGNPELKAYREKLFTDLYTNIIPDRVPIYDGFGYEFFAQINGRSLLESEYNFTFESAKAQIDDVMKFALGDYVQYAPRNPYPILFKKSLTEMVSNTGMQQHPEVEIMKADEYDKLIDDPFAFTNEELIYRNAEAYTKDNPVSFAIALLRNVYQNQDFSKALAEAKAYLLKEYDYFPNPPLGCSGYQLVPFDCIADRNRGFSEITKDIKRQPQKVLDALDALMPYCIDRASKSKIHPLGSNQTMTHMAAFLRTSEFEKFYWKHFHELVHISAERGQKQTLFCEHDWTRFTDHMQDFPMGTRLFMEYGDPKQFKDKLGKNCVLGGFYPLALLKSGTKQQCIDKAKELLDILAPGGNYYFRTDKSILSPADINIENYTAVVEFVKENYKYDNAGENVTSTKIEDTIRKGYKEKYPEFKTSYAPTFEEFIREGDVPHESVKDYMKATYDKYTAMAIAQFGLQ